MDDATIGKEVNLRELVARLLQEVARKGQYTTREHDRLVTTAHPIFAVSAMIVDGI